MLATHREQAVKSATYAQPSAPCRGPYARLHCAPTPLGRWFHRPPM